MKRLGIVLLLLVCQTALPQQRLASLSVTVTDAGSGKPLLRATLVLRSLDGGPAINAASTTPQIAQYPGLTNDMGEFTYSNLPPGRYSLLAWRNDYIRTENGQRGPNGKGVPLTLAAGEQRTGVHISMMPSAAISGHVYDSKGAPYPYVQVNVMRITYPNGQRTLTIASRIFTNDLGAYRLYGLSPGQYVLSAQAGIQTQQSTVDAGIGAPLPGSIVIQTVGGGMPNVSDPANANRRAPGGIGVGTAPVYFQNAIEDRNAAVFDLRPGEDIKGIDFVAGTLAMATVTGTVTVPFANATATIVVTPINSTLSTRAAARGTFSIPLPPGSYVAAGTATSGLSSVILTTGGATVVLNTAGPAAANNTPPQLFAGYTTFTVTPQSAPAVGLSLNPLLEVSGQITFEGRPTSADVARLRVRFQRNTPIIGIPDPAVMLRPDGTFTARNFIDGDYTIQISGIPDSLRGAYLKSIRSKDAEVPNGTFHIGAESVSDLEIVLGAKGGRIEGAALAETREALSNVTVVLVPDQREHHELYQTVVSDASGRFLLDGITPGRYNLFSWEDVEADAWHNPDFLRPFENRGKPVVIAEDRLENLDVAVIPIR